MNAWRTGLACALSAVALCASAASGPATHTIVMEGVAYAPAALTVNVGDSIVFVNKDAFPHTATAQDKTFDSGEIAASRSWKLVTKKRGTFAYICTYHPTMKGTLVVK